jgi:hypothetical protein
MGIASYEFRLPRHGNRPEEYEDASAADVQSRRFALADGATESSFSAVWAQLLVNDFVQNAVHDFDDWRPRLAALQQQWYARVYQPTLPWNVEIKVEQGAYATFLGVALTSAEGEIPQWEATAIGDTCLFHTRGPVLFSAFPIDQSQKFNNSPSLLGSRMSADALRKSPALHIQASGLPNDRLWMMTDALAQWCLSEHEGGRNPWGEIESLLTYADPQQRFAAWIDEIRLSRELRNDDVTLQLLML